MKSRIRLIFLFFLTFILLVDGITFLGLAGDFPAILQSVYGQVADFAGFRFYFVPDTCERCIHGVLPPLIV